MRGTTRGALAWWDHGIGLGLGAIYLAVLWGTAGDLPMSRDESFYVIAAERYGAWLEALVDDPAAALDATALDAAWSYNAEHPPLMKTLFALSHLLQEATGVFPSESHAFRFPGMLTGGLLLWVVYAFGAQATRRRLVGLCAALFVAGMPRVFYHAHLNAFDVPIALMTTATTWAYWHALGAPLGDVGARWRRLLLLGLVYGLALSTKHNSWVSPGIFGIHFLWVAAQEIQRRRQGEAAALDLRPWWLLAMAAVGPLVLWLLWPWLWNDGLARFGAYARFHLNHAYYNMAYFGENHFHPPFPVSFPFVMTAITVPGTTLVLGAVGLGSRLRTLVPPGVDRWAPLWTRLPGPASPDLRATEVLWVGGLLAPLVVIALPSTPIFGATKHWFPAYPFLGLFAGLGFCWALDRLRDWWSATAASRQRGGGRRFHAAARPLATVGLGALVFAPSMVETAHGHPLGLSHYTPLAGGVPGAADLGMNRQFWGFSHGPLLDWIAARLPRGGRVWICDATATSWEMLHRDGRLPANIRVARSMASADLVLVHHELHFAEVDFQAWVAFDGVAPEKVLTYDGVPIVSVYARPESSLTGPRPGDPSDRGRRGSPTDR